MVYYNEFDPGKAEWLRELMRAGAITEGEVDERSIADVRPDDLRGFRRCHFFAGIGIWDYALQLAGWPEEAEVWTASCPCQPFSSAGKRKGKADERHLFPELARLISGRRPAAIFGEQVSSKDGLAWLDDVLDHLEGEAYAARALDTCAAGAGGPHIRQRLYWAARLADSNHRGSQERRPSGSQTAGNWGVHGVRSEAKECGEPGGLADAEREQRQRGRAGEAGGESGAVERAERLRDAGRLADSGGARLEERGGFARNAGRQRAAVERDCGAGGLGDGALSERGSRDRQSGPSRGQQEQARGSGIPGPANGFWAGADWVLTRPQRVGDSPSLRPVESTIKCVFDEFATSVGSGGDQGKPDTEGHEETEDQVGASENQTDTIQAMQVLCPETRTGEVQWTAGGSGRLPEKTILQPCVHGERDGEVDLEIGQRFTGTSPSLNKAELRALWPSGLPACPSYRSEPAEQRSIKFADFVRKLPCAGAFAELRGDTRTAEVMRDMLWPLNEEWAVLQASNTAEEIWRSMPKEVQDRVRVGFASGRWVSAAIPPLAQKTEARVLRLKGYGDGIVATQAAAFVQACAEEWGF